MAGANRMMYQGTNHVTDMRIGRSAGGIETGGRWGGNAGEISLPVGAGTYLVLAPGTPTPPV